MQYQELPAMLCREALPSAVARASGVLSCEVLPCAVIGVSAELCALSEVLPSAATIEPGPLSLKDPLLEELSMPSLKELCMPPKVLPSAVTRALVVKVLSPLG